jgi:crotonobetainyl-CoA:carnitine CoA-transferase CaiB-like acyl-CoA transferase
MSGAQTAMQREVPALGAHRDEILSRLLGLSPDAVGELVDAGAFGKPRRANP